MIYSARFTRHDPTTEYQDGLFRMTIFRHDAHSRAKTVIDVLESDSVAGLAADVRRIELGYLGKEAVREYKLSDLWVQKRGSSCASMLPADMAQITPLAAECVEDRRTGHSGILLQGKTEADVMQHATSVHKLYRANVPAQDFYEGVHGMKNQTLESDWDISEKGWLHVFNASDRRLRMGDTVFFDDCGFIVGVISCINPNKRFLKLEGLPNVP